MDVKNVVAGTNSFALPPGRSTAMREFEMPVSGRFTAIGGHLHDFGVELRLEDASSGAVLFRLAADRDSGGSVRAVDRRYYPLRGLPVKAGRRYRVVGVYDSPERDTLPAAAMAHIVGAFVPNDVSKWPSLSLNDPWTRADVASLPGGDRAAAPVVGSTESSGGGTTVRCQPRAP